jgi:hypothetical protein
MIWRYQETDSYIYIIHIYICFFLLVHMYMYICTKGGKKIR